MEEEVIESTVPADSYAAYKAASLKLEKEPTPDPATDPQPPAPEVVAPVSSAPPVETPAGETPGATDTPEETPSSAAPVKAAKPAETPEDSEQDTQEQKEQKAKERRNRKAEGKIAELSAEGTRERLRAERAEKELEELRKTSAVQPRAAEPAKPEVKPEVAPEKFTEAKPLCAAFTDKLGSDEAPFAGKSYEQLHDMWIDAVDDWRDRKTEFRAAQSEAEAKATLAAAEAETKRVSDAARDKTRQREQDARLAIAKDKYEDYDTVINSAIAAHPNVSNDGIGAAFQHCHDIGELKYALAKDGAKEYLRIAALPPFEAYRETLDLDTLLIKGAKPEKTPAPAKAPEKPKPAVSKAPAPYVPLNGVETPAAQAPKSYKEFKGRA